jgi:hypothetical protein
MAIESASAHIILACELLAGLRALQEAFGDNRKVCHDLCIFGVYEHIFQQLSLARVRKLVYFFT